MRHCPLIEADAPADLRLVCEDVREVGVVGAPDGLGLDLRGGMHVVLEVDKSKLNENEKSDATDRALEVIRNRVDEFGVAEPLIQKSGDDRIIVELPGIADPKRARELIGRTAQLEFKLMPSASDQQNVLDRIDRAVAAALPDEIEALARGVDLSTDPIDLFADTGVVDLYADEDTAATTDADDTTTADSAALAATADTAAPQDTLFDSALAARPFTMLLNQGGGYGMMFLPRIGQEVIVDFLEGDPDQPIITGRVYNAEQLPPLDLPAEKTRSTIKSSSSKGGGGSNEIHRSIIAIRVLGLPRK